MESIKDKVAIVGMGCSKFGERWECDADDLIIEATDEALKDAGVELKDIEAIWVGTMGRVTGATASAPLQTQYVPVTHVENACATGAEIIRAGAYALAAKAYDLVLAVGFEKMKDYGFGGLHPLFTAEKWHPVRDVGGTSPGRYALAATRYFARYGLSREEGKRMLAMISVKSHHNGFRNPKAFLRREVTVEQAMNAPIIAWPLGLYDCCGVADGASAAIMCRTEDAKKFRSDYITIKGCGISSGPGWGKNRTDYDFTHWEETERAAMQAYAQAGIKDPRKELDMVELHDCFSIAEAIAIESLHLSPKGHVKEDIEAGFFTQEGKLSVNLGGGLKSFGHPIGASGAREVYEIYKEIQGKAQEPSRQKPNIRLGLAHSQGGHPGRFMCGVTIVGAP